MKNILLIVIALIITQQAISQDQIIQLNGKAIPCKVSEISDSHIKYLSEGEDFIRNISITKVQEIDFSSGKTEKFNQRVQINYASDWQNVIITIDDMDIENLIPGEDFNISASKNGRSYTNRLSLEEDAIERIKKLAAASGYHIILIDKFDRNILRSTQRGRSTIEISGTGYAYK